MCVCFNSSETAIGTSIRLGTIDDHPVVSVIKGIGDVMMMSYPKMIFLEFALLNKGQPLLAQTKISYRLTTFQKLAFLWGLK